MLDREKVIKGIEACLPRHDPDCDLCPYGSDGARCWVQLMGEALELLKAQEPVEPKHDPGDDDWAHCGHCGARLYERWVGANYCAFCGRAVKWDG